MVTLRSGGATVGVGAAPPTADEQRTLANRIRGGDSSAEEELVRTFRDRIACLVRLRTHDLCVAQDLTQDALLAVVVALRAGHLREPNHLAAFVYGTARNLVNNYLRTRSRLPREDPLDDGYHLACVDDHPLEETDRSTLVRRALVSLDSTDRRILLLTLVNGLKPGEIAAQLGLTSEVVRGRKCRALKKMIDRVKKLSRR
jgi:RNA polymerase sigma factor (sigma-70 family)